MSSQYELSKRKFIPTTTVGELKELLDTLPSSAEVAICGAGVFYLHVAKDNKIICLDTEPLDDVYDEDEENLGEVATKELEAIPGMKESILAGAVEPVEECIPESEVKW